MPPTRTRLYLSGYAGLSRIASVLAANDRDWTEWSTGVHLPCTVRVDYHASRSRARGPRDEGHTNNFTHSVRRLNLLNQLFWRAYITLYYRWKMVSNFSSQDGLMADHRLYDPGTAHAVGQVSP